ncbi:MAG: FAD-dependent oxidoreductase [Paracoccaceae bacterium]
MIDVIVIGGGIAGISASARLSAHAKTLLIEGESALGYHASGRSAAVFEENYGAPAVCALGQASASFYRDGGYLTPRGLMILCKSGEDAAFETDMAKLQCDEISMQRARALVPILSDQVTRGAYQTGAEDIDTDKLIQDFARIHRSNGGEIVFNKRVTQLEKRANGWRVACGTDQFDCAQVVNAAGAWADQIADMAGLAPLGIVPHRRSMARVPAPEGLDVTGWPIFFGPGETWYAKPDAGKLLISPADEDPVEPQDAWADDMVLAVGIDRYQAYVRTEVTRLETSWAGLRSFAPDRCLVLGPDPSDPSFIWSAGQGGYGFSTAPAASQLVADLTLQRTPHFSGDVLAALTPDRLRA